MKKHTFTQNYRNFEALAPEFNVENFTKALTNGLNFNNSEKYSKQEEIEKLKGWFIDLNGSEAGFEGYFVKALRNRLNFLNKDYAKIVSDSGKVYKSLEKAFDEAEKPADIILKEKEYLSSSLAQFLIEKKIDLMQSRVLIQAPTGTGKSTTIGLLPIETDVNILLIKDRNPLVDNAREDLKGLMDESILKGREIYTHTGLERLDDTIDGLPAVLKKEGVIVITNYNNLPELDFAIQNFGIVEVEGRVWKNQKPRKWLYILDEVHHLSIDDYRSEVMKKVEAVLSDRKGVLALSATPKAYCPLNYDYKIKVKKEVEDGTTIKIFPKGYDLRKKFKEEVQNRGEGEVFIYFQDNSAELVDFSEELTNLRVNNTLINADINNRERKIEGTGAHAVTKGVIKDKVLLSTRLLWEGISFNENCTNAKIFVNIDASSAEIIQAAARVRKAQNVEVYISDNRADYVTKESLDGLKATPSKGLESLESLERWERDYTKLQGALAKGDISFENFDENTKVIDKILIESSDYIILENKKRGIKVPKLSGVNVALKTYNADKIFEKAYTPIFIKRLKEAGLQVEFVNTDLTQSDTEKYEAAGEKVKEERKKKIIEKFRGKGDHLERYLEEEKYRLPKQEKELGLMYLNIKFMCEDFEVGTIIDGMEAKSYKTLKAEYEFNRRLAGYRVWFSRLDRAEEVAFTILDDTGKNRLKTLKEIIEKLKITKIEKGLEIPKNIIEKRHLKEVLSEFYIVEEKQVRVEGGRKRILTIEGEKDYIKGLKSAKFEKKVEKYVNLAQILG